MIFILARTVTYAVLFIALVLVFLPARVLSWSGIAAPGTTGILQLIGLVAGVGGAGVTLWCIATFAVVGRGTPAPFDPPRRLVMRGPYAFVRNPMYLGAALALAAAALYYGSAPLAGYTALFLLITHLFVVWYEEPALRRTFGSEYQDYCARVRRWRPSLRPAA